MPVLPVYIHVIVVTVLPCKDMMLIQKSILHKLGRGGVNWLCLIHDRNPWNALLNIVISLDIL